MTPNEMDERAFQRCCGNNAEAKDWLRLWHRYVHQIDDLVDEKALAADPEFVLNTFALAAVIYSHPFYLKNIAGLRQLVLNITNSYADSVRFERTGVEWQREWSDHNRHCGIEIMLAAGLICHGGGIEGYEAMRALSAEFRTMNHEHHNKEGEKI